MKKNKWSSNRNSYNKHSKGGEFIAGSSRSYPSDAIQATPIEVKVDNDFGRAFRTFRAIVQKERILSLYKEKQSFEKPSDKRRRKRNESRRKLFELQMKRNNPQNDERRRDRRKSTEEETES